MFHIYLEEKKKISHKPKNQKLECGYNWLFLFVFHTSSTKLSRRDPLLWTSLTEASFLKKKRKEKKRHTTRKKYRSF